MSQHHYECLKSKNRLRISIEQQVRKRILNISHSDGIFVFHQSRLILTLFVENFFKLSLAPQITEA